MRINYVMLLIALGIAALSASGFYSSNSGEELRILITVGSGVTFFITLAGVLAITSQSGTSNIRVISIIFFIVFLIEHIIFSIFMRMEPYIVITGVLLLLYVLLGYAMNRALKNN